MQVELSEFKSASHSVGKAISWSKKMYVWEFCAKLVNDKNQEQYQKYRIEFKDSVSSGKSTVVFNGVTLLYKSKMYFLAFLNWLSVGFGIAPYILQVKPIEIALYKDQKSVFKSFDLRVAGMSFTHLKKAGGKIPLYLKSALPEQSTRTQEPAVQVAPASQVPPPSVQNISKENQPPTVSDEQPQSDAKSVVCDKENFFNFDAQEVKKVEAPKPTQQNSSSVLALDSEFDFSKNEPIKKQNTMQHDVEDFFDFMKQPEQPTVQRSMSQLHPPSNGPVQADVFFAQQFATNPAMMYQQQPMMVNPQFAIHQSQFMQPQPFGTHAMNAQFGAQPQPLQAFNTNFIPQYNLAKPTTSDCLFTDKYKSFYIQQMAKQNVPPQNNYGFDHTAQYQTRAAEQSTKNAQLNQNLGSLINLNQNQ